MGTHDSQRLPRVCTFLTQLDSPGTGGTSYARLWNAATGEGEEKMFQRCQFMAMHIGLCQCRMNGRPATRVR